MTLSGHQKRVECVKFISQTNILSCGADGLLILWKCLDENDIFNYKSWIIQDKLKLSNEILLRFSLDLEKNIIAVSSSEGNVYLLKIDEEKFEVLDFLCFGKNI